MSHFLLILRSRDIFLVSVMTWHQTKPTVFISVHKNRPMSKIYKPSLAIQSLSFQYTRQSILIVGFIHPDIGNTTTISLTKKRKIDVTVV